MNVLDIAIIAFVIMEFTNVCILYFAQDSKLGNGVAIFKHWEDSKKDENAHLFAKYMAYWVAGVKLIFIVLLLVILFTGSDITKIWGVVAMIISIATYFWKLHPIIKTLDSRGQIVPAGYSKALGMMIGGFLIMFSGALILFFVI
ncbi:MAG: hypothetical protein R3Y35_04495 [Clostridia bacterium]